MPCLFFRNVPPEVSFDPDACLALHRAIATAAGISVLAVEVHIETTRYRLLAYDGHLSDSDQHGVHCFIEWYQWYRGRRQDVKQEIAEAIHRFLVFHDLGAGSDIAFRDSPPGTFFYEGKLVLGGE